MKARDGKEVSDVRHYLNNKTNRKAMITYYKERRRWETSLIEPIGWEALEILLNKANPIRKNRIIKVLHD